MLYQTGVRAKKDEEAIREVTRFRAHYSNISASLEQDRAIRFGETDEVIDVLFGLTNVLARDASEVDLEVSIYEAWFCLFLAASGRGDR